MAHESGSIIIVKRQWQLSESNGIGIEIIASALVWRGINGKIVMAAIGGMAVARGSGAGNGASGGNGEMAIA